MRHYSLQALKPKTNYLHGHTSSTKRKFQFDTSKNYRPTKRPMAGYKGTPQYNSPSTWAELNVHIPMETQRVEVEKFKGGNITDCFEKLSNIIQDQFVLNIVKFGLTIEFAEVPLCQFVPPLNFFPVETEIIDAETFKLLIKGVIVNTTREPNDCVSRIFPRTKKMAIIERYST